VVRLHVADSRRDHAAFEVLDRRGVLVDELPEFICELAQGLGEVALLGEGGGQTSYDFIWNGWRDLRLTLTHTDGNSVSMASERSC
jgi:hypothetical protein